MTIRARIRAALRAGDQQPAEVARRVLDDLPDAELRDALAAALPYLVRDEIRKIRHDAIGRPRTDPAIEPRENRARGWRTDPAQTSAADTAARRRAAGRRGATVAQEQRDRKDALLATPVQVGGEWKKLADCTPGDLRTIACDLTERAAENQRRADGFARLADRLEAAGAQTVKAYATGGRPELRESFLAVT